MKKLIVVLMALLVASVNSFAQKPAVMVSNEPGWHKIGEITANFNMQSESIVVWGADRFAELKLRVTDAPINIERLQVIYESGETEDIDVASEIQAWGESQTLMLKNEDKEIKKVAFTYKTLPNYRGEKAQVELYGYKKGNDGDSYRSDNDKDLNNNGTDDRKDVNRDVDRAEKDVNNAAKRTEDDVEDAANKTEAETKDGVDKVGNKISEAAGNAAAEVNDQLYSGKMGPGGEKIYIDKHSKYYYINSEGKKVHIDKSQVRDRTPKD
jgi:hypothetical protein